MARNFGGRLLCALLLVAGLARPAHADYADAYAIAAADLARLPVEEQLYAVYFWQGDVPEAERIDRLKTASGHVNGLSREPYISVPVPVSKDLAVIRASAKRYGWQHPLLKQLIDADPYATKSVEMSWPGGVYPGDGQHYAAGAFRWYVPVVGLRWFVWQTAIQQDRKPGYYDFLDLKNKADIEKLCGFNEKANEQARRTEIQDSVAFSGVSAQPRAVIRGPAIDGGFWWTEDSKLAIELFNPLRIPDRKKRRHDAEELVFQLPNDHPGFFLNDDKGVRQDTAPDFIGPDQLSPSNDKRIHVGKSCWGCHTSPGFGGSRGLCGFKPYFRNLGANALPLTSPVHALLQGIEAAYQRSFDAALERDRQRFDEAIKQSTGMPADVFGPKYLKMFDDYDAGASAAEAAIYLGCDEKHLVDKLRDYAAKTGQLDPVLGLFLVGERIPRHQYHEVYPLLRKTVSYEVRTLDVRSLLLPVDYRVDLHGQLPGLRPAPAVPGSAIPRRP